jgi:hypothetical protein
MKFLVIFALVALAQSAPTADVENLFSEAWRVQHLLSPKQQELDSEVTELRETLTNVLETRSQGALQGIESNAFEIVEIEAPFREAVAALPAGACKNNLQRQLDMKTEFTGFASSLCVSRYDRANGQTIIGAQEFIANYEGLFVRLQKVVIESFSGNNALIHQADIIEEFNTEYEARLAEWEQVRPEAEDFEHNLDETMGVQESELNSCMLNVRTEATVDFERISNMITVCQEFA